MPQEFYLLLLARDGCGILFDKAAMRTNEGGHQVREPGSGIPETITPMLWSASLTGEVTHISSRVREFSGLTLEDFVNFGWRRFIHPDDFEDIGGASRRTCGACAPTPARIGPHRARVPRLNRAEQADRVLRDAVYSSGREPAMSMSTSLLALCCQSAPEPTCETPISARSRSYASRSLRRSALLLARFTNPLIAPWTMLREPS
jgi:hypothetical protein